MATPKPCILCLHGGGTSAEIFSMQSRSVIRGLAPYFTLLFADAPFLCGPGPGVVPVYADRAPFRRWLRWQAEHAAVGPESAVEEIVAALDGVVRQGQGVRGLMEERSPDDVGAIVGVLGFSQGGKVAASLLLEQQVQRDYAAGTLPAERMREIQDQIAQGEGLPDPLAKLPQLKFGVVCNGRSPLASLSPLSSHPSMVPAGDVSETWQVDEDPPADQRVPEWLKLRTSTVHVHGLEDPGLHIHRWLRDEYCDPKTVRTAQWDGDHRMPLKTADVQIVVNAILDVANQAGLNIQKT